jgi:cell fate (sporulation/competence/biofilm development) regulator YlbF (YheA/YmcA/DUF963 family)
MKEQEMTETTTTASAQSEAQTKQRARALGARLRESAEFRAWVEASQAVSADAAAQNLVRQINAYRTTLWSQVQSGDATVALEKLQTELEALNVVREYRQAERALRDLFRAVDAAIGATAGVEFAANAKRSCCGG